MINAEKLNAALDWNNIGTITKEEALILLAHAKDCLNYVDAALPNTERPHWTWTDLFRCTCNMMDVTKIQLAERKRE